jgi:hypothetical protein
MLEASTRRPYAVAATPTTVVVATRLVISADITDIDAAAGVPAIPAHRACGHCR